MPQLLSPGVFIQEVNNQAVPIQAVTVGGAGFAGYTQRGLTGLPGQPGIAVLKTSLTDFFQSFGPLLGPASGTGPSGDLPHAVAAFFANGGTRAFIARVTPTDAASSAGLIGNVGTVWDLSPDKVIDGITYPNPGEWSNTVTTPTTGKVAVRVVIGANRNYPSVQNPFTGNFYQTRFDVQMQEKDPVTNTWSTKEQYEAVDFGDPTSSNFVSKVINGLTNYISFTQGAGFVAVTSTAADGNFMDPSIQAFPPSATPITVSLSGGADGSSAALTFSDLLNTGFPSSAFPGTLDSPMDVPSEIMNLVIPDFVDTGASWDNLLKMQTFVDSRTTPGGGGPFFLIWALNPNISAQTIVSQFQTSPNTGLISSNVALYWPWVKIQDPTQNNQIRSINPVGHIAGVFARTVRNRNIGKAPGGITDGALLGVVGLTKKTTQGDRDTLYPNRVNPLIDTQQTGIAVWGVRTIDITGQFRFINARLLFRFVEKSLFNATHFAIFENNGSALWERLRLTCTGFLLDLQASGHFAGNTPKDAFFVICDGSNNNANLSAVSIDIGIAPNKPGEFLVITLSQKQVGSTS